MQDSKAEPGASVHGNFVNYYQFHPAAERIGQLPDALVDALLAHDRSSYVALDIGCNAGDLTLELHGYLKAKLPGKQISILGIDLDPSLIERARLKSRQQSESVTFHCVDFTSPDCRPLIDSYLRERQLSRFDLTFCFSVTMWIHLNGGDAGLERFLRDVCSSSTAVLLEPQPWRCYRNASRRLRRAGLPGFPLLDQLNYRGDLTVHLRNILREQCGFRELAVSPCNDWQRKLLFYGRPPASITRPGCVSVSEDRSTDCSSLLDAAPKPFQPDFLIE